MNTRLKEKASRKTHRFQDLDPSILDNLTLPCMILDRKLRFVYTNAVYRHATQHENEDLLGRNVFEVFPEAPDRMEQVKQKFSETLNGRVTTLVAQPYQISNEDGTVRNTIWQATQDPLRDAGGEVTHIFQRAEDITAQHELEIRNRVITYELNHRVKNIMSVIMGIARISGRHAKDLPSFMDGFIDRIGAMARANDRLAHDDWLGLTVEDALKVEISPYGERTGAEYNLSGPKIRLSTDGSKDLSMAVHELLTNATKYGCFSTEGGSLDISWREVDSGLVITWDEHCDFPVTKPERTGFGSRLFTMLPHVSVERDFQPTGLHLTLTIEAGHAFA